MHIWRIKFQVSSISGPKQEPQDKTLGWSWCVHISVFYYMTTFFLEKWGIVRSPDVKLRIKPKEDYIRGLQNLDNMEVTIEITETVR